MKDYRAVLRNAFELGSVRDASMLLEAIISNAFPTFNFRGLELVRILKNEQYIEAKSWNHVFEIKKTQLDGNDVWEVNCHRVTMGKTPDKQVYLDYLTLGFVKYKEIE